MVSVAGGIVIAIVVLAVAAVVGWIAFTQYRARKLGVSTMLCAVKDFLSFNPCPLPGNFSRPLTTDVSEFVC